MKQDIIFFDCMKTILKSLVLLSCLLVSACNRVALYGLEKYLPTAETGDVEASSSSVTFNGRISGLKVHQSMGLNEWEIRDSPNRIRSMYFLLSTDKKFQTDVEQIKANFSSADVDSETDYYKLIHCDYRTYGYELQPNTTYYYKFCAEQGSDDELYAEIHGEVKSFTTDKKPEISIEELNCYSNDSKVSLSACLCGISQDDFNRILNREDNVSFYISLEVDGGYDFIPIFSVELSPYYEYFFEFDGRICYVTLKIDVEFLRESGIDSDFVFYVSYIAEGLYDVESEEHEGRVQSN